MKLLFLFLVVILAVPGQALAFDTDLRLALGTSARSDRTEIANAVGHGSNEYGNNTQVEIVLSPHTDSLARFLIAVGYFRREHPGNIQNLLLPTTVEYSVTGASIAPGVRLRINHAWSAEVKAEIGYSSGDHVTLKSPGIIWNPTNPGIYRSLSLIAGVYYLFHGPAIRVGLEAGAQKFEGDFSILSNHGYWSPGNVSGTDGTANFICGIQF